MSQDELDEKQIKDAVNKQKKVMVHFLKSPAYRTIHSDGVFGGPTPHGHLSMMFFSERQSMPDAVVYSVNDRGEVNSGDDKNRINSRPGFIREMEVNVVMNLNTARVLNQWLSLKIAQIEKEAEGNEDQG